MTLYSALELFLLMLHEQLNVSSNISRQPLLNGDSLL